MKKIITFAIVLFVLMNHSFPVGASQTESVPPVSKEDILYYSEDYSEIKQLEAEIETDLSQYTGKPVKLTDDDYKQAFKIYVDSDLINLNSIREKDVLNTLESGNYVWFFPYLNQYDVTISRGLPLPEDSKTSLTIEEQQQVIENEGKWGIASYGESPHSFYIAYLKEKSIDWSSYSRVVFAGGLHGLQNPVAISFRNGEACDVISLGFTYDAIPDTSSSDENTVMFANENTEDEVYSYPDIIKHAREIDYPSDTSLTGGNGTYHNTNSSLPILIGIVVLITFAILSILILFLKKIRVSKGDF